MNSAIKTPAKSPKRRPAWNPASRALHFLSKLLRQQGCDPMFFPETLGIRPGDTTQRVTFNECHASLEKGWCWQRIANDGERCTVIVCLSGGGYIARTGSFGSKGIGRDRSPVDFDDAQRAWKPGQVMLTVTEGSNRHGSFVRIIAEYAPTLD